jgi:Cytochrome P460
MNYRVASLPAKRMKKAILMGLLLAASSAAQKYTVDGELLLPVDYRQWIFLSSGIGMTYSNEPNAHPMFDNSFVKPAAYKAFLNTGTWPDKTVLLLENRAAGSNASNKDGKFQTKLMGFEAHVKDSAKGGWMFYYIPPDSRSGKALPKTAVCYTCHEKNAATDTTFVQFYPTLIETAKKKGTYREPTE